MCVGGRQLENNLKYGAVSLEWLGMSLIYCGEKETKKQVAD